MAHKLHNFSYSAATLISVMAVHCEQRRPVSKLRNVQLNAYTSREKKTALYLRI
jgi:hypothetical protein